MFWQSEYYTQSAAMLADVVFLGIKQIYGQDWGDKQSGEMWALRFAMTGTR